jgi:NAD(P)-dependent dehydrogenase (short-subunit alcohol dehydrogenase family)|tara:strand:- start:4426 stop:5259 length:834 start_codon:yes stop_codon:yes gene_type:complete
MDLTKFNLLNKNILITGGAGLLGLEHAAAILEVDGNVILTDVSEGDLSNAKKALSKIFDESKITTLTMDVTSLSEIQKVMLHLSGLGIRVDVLINNAAIDPKVSAGSGLNETSRLENFLEDEWDAQLSVGLKGAFLCSQVFGTAMAGDSKGGVIINIASDLSVFSPDQRIYRKDHLDNHEQPVKPVTYSVIKSGLIGLTRYLATYWSEQGVRSNALSPGGIFLDQDDQFVEKLTSLIPMGRMAKKNEYRSAIQFLCSDASSYLNGQNVVMDGGRSVW